RARRPGGQPRRLPGGGGAPHRAAHTRRLGSETRFRAVPAHDVRPGPAPHHVPGAGEAAAGRAVGTGCGPRGRAGRYPGDLCSLANRRRCYGAWLPISCIILNIGRYIAMMMTPTIIPTPIIMIGSMIEVRFAIALSTSSS